MSATSFPATSPSEAAAARPPWLARPGWRSRSLSPRPRPRLPVPDPADPYSAQSIGKQRLSRRHPQVLTLDTPVLGEPTVLHAEAFGKLTGAKLEVTRVPFPRLYQETLLGLRQDKYDVLFFGSMWIADVLPHLEPLPRRMLQSPEYRDVLPHYQRVASWGDKAYMVPIDGDRHYLQYRRDLLENPVHRAQFRKATGRDLGVPATWPELQEIARFFQGRKLPNGDTISGIAEVRGTSPT